MYMQLPRATGEQVNVPDRLVGGSTTGLGAVDTGVEAGGRAADTGTGGRDDDENTGREPAPGTSSAVEVAGSCVLPLVVEEVAARSSRTMSRIVCRKSAMERSETWRSAAEFAALGSGGLAALTVSAGGLVTTWLSVGGGGGC